MSSLVPRPTMAFAAGESGFHIADNKNFLKLVNEAMFSPPMNLPEDIEHLRQKTVCSLMFQASLLHDLKTLNTVDFTFFKS